MCKSVSVWKGCEVAACIGVWCRTLFSFLFIHLGNVFLVIHCLDTVLLVCVWYIFNILPCLDINAGRSCSSTPSSRLSRRPLKIGLNCQNDALWGPAGITATINNATTAGIWVGVLLSHCFLRFCCGDAFCADTLLQTDDVTHRNLYTEQFLCADTLTQWGLCTEKLFTRRCLYTQRLLRKEKFTQTFIHTDALHKDAFARINKGTQALLHTEPFKTEKPLAQNNSYTTKLLRRKTLTQKNLCTQTQTPQRSFYTPKFLHAETLPRTTFTHIFFFRTETFTHRSLNAQFFFTVYTQMPLHRKLLHTEICAHSTLLHTASFYTERLCFPFFITYFRRPPLKLCLWNMHIVWEWRDGITHN